MKKNSTILEIDDLSVSFDGVKAVKDISTAIGEHEIRFFTGPDGAGKTTVLDAISGRNKPSRGRIIYKNKYDLLKMPAFRVAELGIARTFQSSSVFNGVTVHENMEISAIGSHSLHTSIFEKLSKASNDRIQQVLDLAGLYGKQFEYPSALSSGEKQCLEIGMLIVPNPGLLLLDEPAAGMERGEEEKIIELLRKIRSECSVIVAENDLRFVFAVADSITVFYEGEILDEGSTEKIGKNPRVIEVCQDEKSNGCSAT
ncbi:MAG: ATP-binding cassette domain-containing protein [Syntrophomonadaceae bacterium]|nr:ATP-binding cassette domain-containing protein [Syntrophomonadaceae bacterium]